MEKDSHLLLKKIQRDIISGKIGILGKGFGAGSLSGNIILKTDYFSLFPDNH